MKGVIIVCLKELVCSKFGEEKWNEIMENSDSKGVIFLAGADIEDSKALSMVDATCKVLNISLTQAADAFGDYWVSTYAKKMYSGYYKPTTAKDFLLQMDDVHVRLTKSIPNAKPPRFSYDWKDDNTLIMSYQSHRGLIDFLAGLAKGVGNYFNEPLSVTKLGNSKIQVSFK